MHGEIQRQWDKIKDIEKKIFLLNTPISEREREYCICRKRFNKNDPSSPMVVCNICDEWYHVECVRFFYPFVIAVPFFVCSNCVDTALSGFLSHIKRGINNRHFNSYINAPIQILLGYSVAYFLPDLMSYDTEIIRELLFVKKHLSNTKNMENSFEMKNRSL